MGGEGCLGRYRAGPESPNSSSVSDRYVSKKLSWDQKCSLTSVFPAQHGVKTVTASLVLQGKPLFGGNSLCPIRSPTESPKPQFFTFTFLLGSNIARGNKFTVHSHSAKVFPPPFGFYPFPLVILALATCCCE